MLHKIETKGWENNKAWCVPTAVSLLTGAPLIHTHSRAAYYEQTTLNKVKGVALEWACLMIGEQGYKVEPIDMSQYTSVPTLRKFMKGLTQYQRCMPLFIHLEKAPKFSHVVASHFGYLADNWTMKPVKPDHFPHMNKYVCAAFVISKKV